MTMNNIIFLLKLEKKVQIALKKITVIFQRKMSLI